MKPIMCPRCGGNKSIQPSKFDFILIRMEDKKKEEPPILIEAEGLFCKKCMRTFWISDKIG